MGSELLVIFIVALIVFGPAKLPMLATHLAWLYRSIQQIHDKMSILWQQQINELHLLENQSKAKTADAHYRQVIKHKE